MSILGRLKSMLVEKVVEDEFTQPVTEHEVYAIINKTGPKGPPPSLKLIHSQSTLDRQDALEIAGELAHHSPELEFRLLGTDPSLEAISAKVGVLKTKLEVVDGYLLQHFIEYLQKVGKSVGQFEEGREFYATRRKVGEARFLLEKMSRLLSKSKAITRLNITIKNLRNTLKLVEKVPNIKKMGLVELKAIDLGKLERTNQEVKAVYGAPLNCLTNLSKYITKVNLESFTFIINNLKMCLDSFESRTYEEIIRSYLIINPPAPLEQLLISLLLERIRLLEGKDINQLSTLGSRLVALIINLHKIIKWHIINRALKHLSHSQPIHNDNETEEEPHRRLSVSSNNSEEAPTIMELGEIVYIAVDDIKQAFSKTVDSSLTDLVSDSVLSGQEIEGKQLFETLQVLAKISEICRNFTGRRLQKLRRALLDHFNRRESALFVKAAKQLTGSIEQEKSDWNRLAFPNHFLFTPIDRLLYRWKRMQETEEYGRAARSLNGLFCQEEELLEEGADEQALQLKIVRLDSMDRLQKRFQEWNPKDYLQLYEGDVIVSQSSYKMLGVLQKYTEFLMYAPSNRHVAYLQHMLFFVEYMAYFIFSSLLSSKYRCLFFEPTHPDTPLEKAYTLKRFRTLYPHLSTFVVAFRNSLEHPDSPHNARLLAAFRKEVKEASGEDNQVLRAKVVAIEATKYCLAYVQQILKGSPVADSEAGRKLAVRVIEGRAILQDLCVLLLTESSQSIVGLELQTIRSLFQSIRWYETYQDLREYVQKIVGIVRESLERLKGSHRGEIPLPMLCFVFVFVWRTILTFSVRLFLQGKGNNRRDNKLNFQKFIDDLYLSFESPSFPALPAAYTVFKSIFRILLSNNWEECRQLLVETLHKFDYIYPILMSLLENSEHMATLAEREKEFRRAQIRSEIEVLLREGK